MRSCLDDSRCPQSGLANLFVLLDSRLSPQAIDLEFIEWLGLGGVPFSIVFTKTDKQSRSRLMHNIETYRTKLYETWESLPPIFMTSSEKREGREEILDYIEKIVEGQML